MDENFFLFFPLPFPFFFGSDFLAVENVGRDVGLLTSATALDSFLTFFSLLSLLVEDLPRAED